MVRRELIRLHVVYRALALHGGSWHGNGRYVVVDGTQSLRVVLETSRTEEGRCDKRGPHHKLTWRRTENIPGSAMISMKMQLFCEHQSLDSSVSEYCGIRVR